MQGREFLRTLALVTPALAAAAVVETPAGGRKFTMKYGPHFGMFRESAGKSLVDQLKFAADHGFTGWEDNEMKSRPVEVQAEIAAAMQKLGIEMGVISALRGVW